jgi:hypothetical protein
MFAAGGKKTYPCQKKDYASVFYYTSWVVSGHEFVSRLDSRRHR